MGTVLVPVADQVVVSRCGHSPCIVGIVDDKNTPAVYFQLGVLAVVFDQSTRSLCQPRKVVSITHIVAVNDVHG